MEDWNQYPKTRKEAMELGSKYYFTGEPCKYGHVAPRKTKGACVECVKEDSKKRDAERKEYFATSEASKAAKRRYYEKNKEVIKAKALARPEEDKRRYRNKHKQNNPDLYKALTNQRRRRFRQATPAWLTAEHRREIREKYQLALAATKQFGVQYVVDHIIPLQGETVCGLHVPWNLQVMRHEDNLAKSNKLLEENHAPQERNLVQGNRTEHKD